MDKLAVYWEQAKDATALVMAFLERAKSAPMEIWEGSAGEAGTRMFIVLVLIGVAFGLISLIVSFFKASWRGKLHILLVTVLTLMVVGVILWYGLKDAEAAALPEADTIAVGETEALTYPQYTLDHDAEAADWKLTDDVFTVRVGGGTVVQLAGLDDVDGRVFFVNSFRREENGEISAMLIYSAFAGSATGDIRGWGTNDFLELRVIPGGRLAEQPWYAAAGETREAWGEIYTVLENEDDHVLFLREDGWLAENGDPLRAVCLARQEGPDVVMVSLRTISMQIDYHVDSNERDNGAASAYSDYDPAADADLRARLGTQAAAFLDGHVTLLRDLSMADAASVLPERVTVPGDGKDRGFSVPCEELVELGSDETSQYIRFYGPDADGERVLYTMQNGGVMLMNDRTGEYEAWEEAYRAGRSEPDAAMSALLGGTAVAYEDGWLMNPGAFIRRLLSEENYYYLTVR